MTRRWLLPVTSLALLASALHAHAATGARVFLQAWNPLTIDQTPPITLLDHPSLVSDSLQDAWAQVRPKICERLRLEMGVGGAARGETLHDITCLLDEQVVLNVTPAGLNALRASFAVSGYVEASSTTPDVALGIGVDRALDPRFSVALTAKLDLTLAVQPNRDQTLRVLKAQFTLNNATLDSQNITGDLVEFILEDLVPFFGGPDYKNLAERAINAISINLANDINAALAPLNAQLIGPSEAVRVGASGKADYVSVAFAPREITPPSNGRMSGVLRWDSAQFTPRNGCQSFIITATVQTGPVPMFVPAPKAPTRQVGTFQANPINASSCAYTLSGIADGWPNALSARVLDPPVKRSSGNASHNEVYALSSDSAQGAVVVPQPSIDGRDYTVQVFSVKLPPEVSPSTPYSKKDYRNPEINRAEFETNRSYRTQPKMNSTQIEAHQVNPTGIIASRPGVSIGASRQSETVSLNPQPLPPAGSPALQTRAIGNIAAAKQLQVTTVPALGNSIRSATPPPVETVPELTITDSAAPTIAFNPPLLNDGAQLWACVNDIADEANDQACAGPQSAQAYCQDNGYDGGLALRDDGSPALVIDNAQPEVPVRAVNGDNCFGASCQVISELTCIR